MDIINLLSNYPFMFLTVSVIGSPACTVKSHDIQIQLRNLCKSYFPVSGNGRIPETPCGSHCRDPKGLGKNENKKKNIRFQKLNVWGHLVLNGLCASAHHSPCCQFFLLKHGWRFERVIEFV